ncbi:hypothetical protein [Streptomyces sp. CC208A]|uniref:hypothetical protein n=1 Tax=Streptomyces sp. CC208A TaxID=3044573 RepID=UPI0024A8ACBF|nr:hypothetical protein [Streptomyces sp. CC208A]
MRIKPALTTASLIVTLTLTLTGCSSYTVNDCRKALTDTSTETNRPKECQDISQADYEALLMSRDLDKALDGLSDEDKDLLDYHDDGQLNDSITGG